MTTETPKALAARLMREVEEKSQANYTKGEVKSILNRIATTRDPASDEDDVGSCRAPATVTELRRGDVFIGRLVGGKVRPWIVLHIADDIVSAVAMSSGDSAPGMTRSECRLWQGSWIGATVTLFKAETAMKEVTRPYTNHRHLAEIEAHVAKIHGMAVVPKVPEKRVVSIAEIAKRIRK